MEAVFGVVADTDTIIADSLGAPGTLPRTYSKVEDELRVYVSFVENSKLLDK